MMLYGLQISRNIKIFFVRGSKLSDSVGSEGFVKGDFGALRQLVAEYLSTSATPQPIREQYGRLPVLNILVEAYVYLIARFDLDGFRMDTVKYVNPLMVEIFGNAIREFALSIGKRNFFTFGEVYDDEQTINNFVGRNTSSTEGFGIDAALDFPLFYKLPGIAKSNIDVDELRKVFKNRKETEKNLLSSHGEAGKYFVSFLDNHDQKQRFNHPLTPNEQVLLGLAVLFCLQGIPALYYGTEQGLNGTKDQAGNIRVGDNLEAVREALWGKTPVAFDKQNSFYQNIQQFGILRSNEPALKYGRLYFREVSGNGKDFGFSTGLGGVVAFSPILFDREIVVIANTNNSNSFEGFVILDLDINRAKPAVKVVYSNIVTVGEATVQITDVTIYGDTITSAESAILSVKLAPMEVQILTPK
jgi:glycosidase